MNSRYQLEFDLLKHKVARKISKCQDINAEIKQGTEILILMELREVPVDLSVYRKEVETWRQRNQERGEISIDPGILHGREHPTETTQKLLSCGRQICRSRSTTLEGTDGTADIGTATMADLQEELLTQTDRKILCSRLFIVAILVLLGGTCLVSTILYMYFRF